MKVYLWQSYSSNNSSSFRVIARFKNAEQAIKAAAAVEKHYQESPYRPEWAGEVDDYDSDDVGNPEVFVAGSTVAVYHNYTDDMSFLENLPYSPIDEHGGELGEVEDAGVTLQAIVRPPDGARGSAIKKDLDAFFKQAESSGKKRPPWAKKAPKRWRYNNSGLLWFRAGDTYGIHMTPRLGDEASWMREYFDSIKAAHRMYLCDEAVLDKIRLLSARPRCPECGREALSLLMADGKTLTEDQLLCSGCGGMFTFRGLTASASKKAAIVSLGDCYLERIRSRGDLAVAVGGSAFIFRGQRWKRLPKCKSLRGVHFRSDEEIYLCGSGGSLKVSGDGGRSFDDLNSNTDVTLNDFSESPDGTIFVAGDDATLLRSKDGKSWRRLKVPALSKEKHIKPDLYAVHAASDKVIYACGQYGRIRYSKDGGNSWVAQKNPAIKSWGGQVLCGVWALDEDTAVVVGGDGTILTTQNGGKAWTARKNPAKGSFKDIARGNDGRLYAITDKNELLFSANKGVKWTKKTPIWRPVDSERPHGICTTPAGVLLLCTTGGRIVQVDDLDSPAEVSVAGATAKKKVVAKKKKKKVVAKKKKVVAKKKKKVVAKKKKVVAKKKPRK